MSATLPIPSSSSPSARWAAPLLALAALVLALCLLYRDTLVGMVTIWNRSETFAHCFLVLPISLWLVWRSRTRLDTVVPAPQPWLLLLVVAMAFLWLMADLAGLNAATQFAFVTLLVALVPAVLGLRVARVLAFPLLFLFFMVPVGEFLLPQFMEWTADFTVFAIQMSGIPVYREGLNFVIPSGSWSVVEACSGVRYMIASAMVGSLFAYLTYDSWRKRILFCLVSLIVPLVANWLRAYMIVMLGHLSGNKLAVGVDHLIYGWVFFGIVIGVMFLIGSRWADPARAPATPGAGASLPMAAPAGGAAKLALTTTLALAILVLPHVAAGIFERQNRSAASAPFVLGDLPGAPAAPAQTEFAPVLLNPSSQAVRTYLFEGQAVTLHVGYYHHQNYERKLVTSQNFIVPPDHPRWRLLSTGTARLQPAGQEAQAWRSAEVVEGFVGAAASQRGPRLDVRQAYWAGGRLTASSMRASLYSVTGRLLGNGDDGALITLYTSGDNAEQTSALLARFVAQHMPAVLAQLQAYRASR